MPLMLVDTLFESSSRVALLLQAAHARHPIAGRWRLRGAAHEYLLDVAEVHLAEAPWFEGAELTTADVLMSYPMESAIARGYIEPTRNRCHDWYARMTARPAFQRAKEKDGRPSMVLPLWAPSGRSTTVGAPPILQSIPRSRAMLLAGPLPTALTPRAAPLRPRRPRRPINSHDRARLRFAELSGPRPRALRFSPDGTRITFLRPKIEDRMTLDLWAMDVDAGAPYRLVDARALAPEERALSEAEIQSRERARITQGGIVRYDWDEAGEALLVPLDGDVFYVDAGTGEARRLMATESYETDARISPGGRYVSFVRDQNVWLHDLRTGSERALTERGAGLVSWGVAEFVAQEEMDRRAGYWWSPDDRWLAIARVDESPVEVVQRFGISADGGRSPNSATHARVRQTCSSSSGALRREDGRARRGRPRRRR